MPVLCTSCPSWAISLPVTHWPEPASLAGLIFIPLNLPEMVSRIGAPMASRTPSVQVAARLTCRGHFEPHLEAQDGVHWRLVSFSQVSHTSLGSSPVREDL